MLENCRNARERWGGVSDLIDRWLKERQDLLVQYCELSGVTDFSQPAVIKARLTSMCQVLMDYVSAGHFEVYEQLISEAREFDDGGLELAAKLYPLIEDTTGVALAFNDQLDKTGDSEADIRSLFAQLSALGEALETRFGLEDMLIEKLHNVHADQVAEA
ncbi:MAG: sigma D regulator [Marinobacter sp.]|nr:sigma D regulator [Marinobacter sp.]